MENTFHFKFIDIVPYTTKSGKEMQRVVAYCSFGYIVNFFVSTDKANKLLDYINNDLDFNDLVRVFYDNNKQQFAYIINI